jgi:thioesterase domain-containing protein
MVPGAIVVLGALPLTPNGKVDRRALPVPDSRPELARSYVAPRDEMEAQLAKIWKDVLGVQRVGVRDNYFELGGHSLLAVRLFAQIHNRFGTNLSLSTLFQAPTIEQLAGILRQGGSSGPWPSLVAIRPTGSMPPLFCVHAARSNILIYRPLARYLDSNRPVYGLQAQGLDGKTVPATRVEDLAAHYLREICTVQPRGPYCLLGASFGGLVVLEMAQQLLKQGKQVAFVGMLDTFCPVWSLRQRIRCHVGHLVRRGPKVYGLAVARSLTRRLWRKAARLQSNSALNARSMPIVEGLEFIEGVHPGDTNALARTVEANLQAEHDYVPRRYPGRITYFLGRDEEFEAPYEDNRHGWARFAGGGLEVHVVPGNHGTMREEPLVEHLAAELSACLHRAEVASPDRM